MSSRNAFAITISVSLVSALLTGILSFRLTPPAPQNPYIILETDASSPDGEITRLLSGLFPGKVISESTQWVYLDDFGELKKIPLAAYEEYVEPFDPRNDGYAEELRAFFVSQGKRRFLVFHESGMRPGALRGEMNRIGAALSHIPHTVSIAGFSRPILPCLFLFLFAAAASFVLAGPLKRIFLVLPVLPGLSVFGPAGFTAAAALLGVYASLSEPLGEYFISRRYRTQLMGEGSPGKARSPSFGRNIGAAALFFAAYALLCAAGTIPFLICLAVLVSFLTAAFLSFWAESKLGMGIGHIRFIPIRIKDGDTHVWPLPRMLLPFMAASVLSLLLPLLYPDMNTADKGLSSSGYASLDKAAYEEHGRFQSSFSFLPLGSGLSQAGGAYFRYHSGSDGLISGSSGIAPPSDRFEPFPLEAMVSRMNKGEGGAGRLSGGREILPVLMALLVYIPFLLKFPGKHRKKGRFSVYNDRRIAA
ncbi:hypothetical protein LJC14_06575 [Treponema sp. OttesenSCG-928-L16]|nr:hypothetical protein [Treponema sp. OttesenSCG-928-L16]